MKPREQALSNGADSWYGMWVIFRMLPHSERSAPAATAQWFATTHWSLVLAARNHVAPEAQAALEVLCRSYWFPLYAYLRRQGYNPHDAQDLTQEFLARLIANHDLQHVEPQRGKFRSFLLGTLKHFLSDERKKAHAQKRGGGQALVSIDEDSAESRYALEPADAVTPETLFERQWALTVLQRVRDRLRARHEQRGKVELFETLEPCLGGSRQPVSYAEVGSRLGMSEGSVKVAVHRLRKEFGELLRQEIAGARTRHSPSRFETVEYPDGRQRPTARDGLRPRETLRLRFQSDDYWSSAWFPERAQPGQRAAIPARHRAVSSPTRHARPGLASRCASCPE